MGYLQKPFSEVDVGIRNGVSLVYHTHIDALKFVPSQAIDDFRKLGFVPFNFRCNTAGDATESDLSVDIGNKNTTPMFVFNYQSGSLNEAKEVARYAGVIMREHDIAGYTEVERVYERIFPNKPFNNEEFDQICSGSKDKKTLPFYAEKAPLSEDMEFSAGEIHLTLPRSIDGKVALHSKLLEALFKTGLYGPDIKTDFQTVSGVTYELLDIPLTLSAANMRELTTFSKALLYVFQKTGWSDDPELTEGYPARLKYELMEEHEWFGDLDPSKAYRDVLWKTHFSECSQGRFLEEKTTEKDFVNLGLFAPRKLEAGL